MKALISRADGMLVTNNWIDTYKLNDHKYSCASILQNKPVLVFTKTKEIAWWKQRMPKFVRRNVRGHRTVLSAQDVDEFDFKPNEYFLSYLGTKHGDVLFAIVEWGKEIEKITTPEEEQIILNTTQCKDALLYAARAKKLKDFMHNMFEIDPDIVQSFIAHLYMLPGRNILDEDIQDVREYASYAFTAFRNYYRHNKTDYETYVAEINGNNSYGINMKSTMIKKKKTELNLQCNNYLYSIAKDLTKFNEVK